MELNDQYWSNRYQQQDTGWDIGEASRPFVEFFNSYRSLAASILIPGCGNSYEAEHLLKLGFQNITLIDISETLVLGLKQKFVHEPRISVLHQNFFDHRGQYDLILEQTFFCALDPVLRPQYAAKMNEIMAPGAILVGLLFDFPLEQGPPFGGNEKEYRALFDPYFQIQKMEPCYNSIEPRKGRELFIKLQKSVAAIGKPRLG